MHTVREEKSERTRIRRIAVIDEMLGLAPLAGTWGTVTVAGL
jgi:hypothetical protein